MIGWLRRLRNWLVLGDYEEAKKAASRRVVSQVGSDHPALSRGAYLEQADLDRLHEKRAKSRR